jgi:flagellar hook-associated protein 1 FlgK
VSGLFGLLGQTSNTLAAQSYGLDVTGQNLANVNTAGYSRRVVTFGAVPPPDSKTSAGGGVEVLYVTAIRNAIYDRRLYQELPHSGRESAIVDALSVVEASLGQSGASLDKSLTNYFDAWATLADNPTSSVARATVLAQGQALATDFNNMAARLDTSAQDTDRQVRTSVDTVNSLTTQIASLNAKMSTVGDAGKATLKDQQTELIKQLAGLASVQVVEQSDGTVQISMEKGQPLVIGQDAYTLDITNEPVTGRALISSQGTDITSQITAGSIGGLLNVRDTLIPGYKTQLDDLAYGVVTQVNTLHDAGYTLGGVDAPNFFTPLASAAGAASLMSVNAAVVADPTLIAAAGAAASPGDNTTATALAALRNGLTMNAGKSTFADAWGQLVAGAGQDISTAQAELKSRSEVITQIDNLRDAVSGVNMDEETANMMKFQTAYEANARFFTTVNQLLDTLMGIGA